MKRDLQRHIERRHSKNRLAEYACESCDYSTKQKACFFKHMRVTHEEPCNTIFKCKLCNYTTTRIDSLILHSKNIHGSNDLNADFIENVETKSTQEKVKTKKCKLCQQPMKSELELTEHLMTNHVL